MEVDDYDKLVLRTGLEEGVLDVREGDVHGVAFLGEEADTVLMDLQVPNGLLAHDVRADDQVL